MNSSQGWLVALEKCFGIRHLGSIFGWLNIPFMLGKAIARSRAASS